MHEYTRALNEQPRRGTISRRGVLRHATILGLSLGAVQVILAACSQAPAAPTSAPAPTVAPAATAAPAPTTAPPTAAPQPAPAVLPSPTAAPTATGGITRGGTLIVTGLLSPTRFNDPALLNSVPESDVMRCVCDWLVRVEPDLSLSPALATKWTPSSDGLTWTVELRKGVTFNHGKPFTADDVVFTFNRLLDPNIKSAFRSVANYLPANGAIEKVDDFTVKFHAQRVVADFPYHLHDYHAGIVPTDFSGDFYKTPYGTGPFTLVDYQPDTSVTFQARKDYWKTGADGKPLPYVDKLQVLNFPDDASLLNAMKTGQVHVGTLSLALMPQVLQLSDVVRPIIYQINNFFNGVMHCDEKPFSDNRVRQALKLAVNRDQYIKTVLVGYGIPAYDQPIAPKIFPLSPTIEPVKQDVAKAKQLLADAGYPNGLDLQVYLNPDNSSTSLALWLQQSAAPAGFRMTLKPRPDYFQIWLQKWGDNIMGIDNWAQRATMSEFFNIAYRTGGDWNETHWSNKQFDDLLVQSDAELDTTKRKAIYQKMSELIETDGGLLAPAYYQHTDFASLKLQGYVPSPIVSPYWDAVWLKP
jgi:peptide/nickel transport system substrate-binding protein